VKQLKVLASKRLEDLGGLLPFVYSAVLALFNTLQAASDVTTTITFRKHHLSPASSCYGPSRQTALNRVKQKEWICLTESIFLRATAFGWKACNTID